jgi:cytochrome b pre-mRNA-processing protein 3
MFGLFRKDPLKDDAEAIFVSVSAAARLPVLYARHGVPDTVEGRFESLAMHVFLVTRRLDQCGEDGKRLAQHLIDRFFEDLDGAVRAIGIGDLSVGKKVKAFARNFYGRVEAYSAGLQEEADPDLLEAAILRNLLGAAPALAGNAPQLAAYLRSNALHLSRLDTTALRGAKDMFITDALE